jgi:uncharacterized protein (DUF58 family)
MPSRAAVPLPSPRVRFGPDFLARLGRLAARVASLRERREGQGHARLTGVGAEFVGHRPYRSGEDLRSLDWNLLARLGRPYVRVNAREASEAWAIWVDTSASMGVGRPGKWQLAAEVAMAAASLALARRATVEIVPSSAPGEVLRLGRREALGAALVRLERIEAGGDQGLATLLARRRPRGAGRVLLIGDFLDLEPRGALALAGPRRELCLARILAREELDPPPGASVRWVDAETGATRVLAVDAGVRQEYERRLSRELERWDRAAQRARAASGTWTSDTPFERVVEALLG